MNKFLRYALNLVIGCVLFASATSFVQAQATRTWVSGVGDDANPCSRTAPCKTFPGAISKTAASGEINALDPGGFGAVTITKAITIEGAETLAGILVNTGNAINVNAGVTDVITLRNLDINGLNAAPSGIRFLAGKTLNVENCVIFGFVSLGIDAQSTTDNSFVSIKNTIIRKCAGGGVSIKTGGTAVQTRAVIDNTYAEDCNGGGSSGFLAGLKSDVTISNSTAANNGNAGFVVNGASAKMTISRSVASANVNGIRATNGTINIADNYVIGNTSTGLFNDVGGSIISFGDNVVAGNLNDGAPNSTLPRK